jgi:hypothetical protein
VTHFVAGLPPAGLFGVVFGHRQEDQALIHLDVVDMNDGAALDDERSPVAGILHRVEQFRRTARCERHRFRSGHLMQRRLALWHSAEGRRRRRNVRRGRRNVEVAETLCELEALADLDRDGRADARAAGPLAERRGIGPEAMLAAHREHFESAVDECVHRHDGLSDRVGGGLGGMGDGRRKQKSSTGC